MRFSTPLLLAALSPALAGAYELPNIDFDDYTTPSFDAQTFTMSYSQVYAYGKDSAYEESMDSLLLEMGFVIDTSAKTFTLQDNLQFTVELDSAKRVKVFGALSSSGFEVSETRAEYVWGKDGKLSQVVSKNIHDPDWLDSTDFIWTHPNCADSRTTFGGLERITWTVDGKGRCATGVGEYWNDSSDLWMESSVLHWTWGASGPEKEVEIENGTDTVKIQRITYVNGLPNRDTTWSYEDGDTSMEACQNTYLQGAFRQRSCQSATETFSTTSTLILSSTTGTAQRTSRALLPVEATELPGRIVFRNGGTERVQLQVVQISGSTMETLVLEPGRTASLPVAKGSIVWRATSPSGNRSGVLNAVR
jgi:hypothetical protein